MRNRCEVCGQTPNLDDNCACPRPNRNVLVPPYVHLTEGADPKPFEQADRKAYEVYHQQLAARTCQWEKVSPPSICGKPAVSVISGKHFCREHSEALGRRFPSAAAERQGDWILTRTGRKFYVQDPRAEDVDIEDVAHALANVCRFGGHTNVFYSVAQHSVLCCDNAPAELKLLALMHDATEAYIGDMVRPLKKFMPDFVVAEDRIWAAICERFEIAGDVAQIKTLDNRALMTERRDIMPASSHRWSVTEAPFPERIIPWTPTHAKAQFLGRFVHLTGGVQ